MLLWLMLPCPAVFCAFAHWMHAQQGLAPEEKRAIAARILPHIRFATMRLTTVATYWHAYDWFRCACPTLCRLWQQRLALCSCSHILDCDCETAGIEHAHMPWWCREYDASRELLVEALVHGADPRIAADVFRGADLAARFKRRATAAQPSFEFVSEVSSCAVWSGKAAPCGSSKA